MSTSIYTVKQNTSFCETSANLAKSKKVKLKTRRAKTKNGKLLQKFGISKNYSKTRDQKYSFL